MVLARAESRGHLSARRERLQAKTCFGLGGLPQAENSGLPAIPPESGTHATVGIAAAKRIVCCREVLQCHAFVIGSLSVHVFCPSVAAKRNWSCPQNEILMECHMSMNGGGSVSIRWTYLRPMGTAAVLALALFFARNAEAKKQP